MGDDLLSLRNYIAGVEVEPKRGTWFEVFNPADGSIVALAARSGAEDASEAVAAACDSFQRGVWAHLPERARATVLLEISRRIRERREYLARTESTDSGKPLADAEADIDEAAYLFEYYAGWVTKLGGEIPPVGPHAMSLVLREPVGVVVCITPWNYPMLMAAQKIAPALAAGCSVIVKPAEQTPMATLELARIATAAGLPDGVLNVVHGYGMEVGEALVDSPLVDMVSFTGSLEVGRRIQQRAAHTVKKVTLELGGKSPNIVFADADLEAAIRGSCFGVFWNQGEVCSAGSRVFVHRAVWQDFLDGVGGYVNQLRIGHPLEAGTTMGPLVSKEHWDRVHRYVEVGLNEGARPIFEGRLPDDPRLQHGYYLAPIVFSDVTAEMTIMREEIFGPVMSIIPFDSDADAVQWANDTPYGLAAAIWTRDIGRALNTAKAVRAGTVWINDSQPAPSESPWGGYRQSGNGRELGRQGLEEFLETKHIYVNLKA